MESQLMFTMPNVTSEEYRMLEKMFLRHDYKQEPIHMSGEAFLVLFQEVRRQVSMQRLKPAEDNEIARETGQVSDVGKQKKTKPMDGIGFLWGFFSNNLPNQINHRLQKRYRLLKDSPRHLPPANNIEDESRHMDDTAARQEGRNLDGIHFLWSFFSNNLPSQLSKRMQKRYEQLRDPAKELQTVDKLHGQTEGLQLLFGHGRRLNDDTCSISSVCSTISFITASETSSTEPNSDTTVQVEGGVLTPVLGCQDMLEENYLETPSSSESGSISEDLDSSNLSVESFEGKNLFYSTQYINEIDYDKSSNSSFSSGTSWEML